MRYVKLTAATPDAVSAEILMAALADLPFESFEQDECVLSAYITEEAFDACKPQVDELLAGTGVAAEIEKIEPKNWNALWESNFDPVDVDGKCLIRAPFHAPAPEGVEEVVIMPKMSFGTGHHATTWLMSAQIFDLSLAGKKVLDMGSGTGVLAILAVKRGAAHADAVDIDEWAFENGRENIAANGVADRVRAVLGDVSAVPDEGYDVILANINRNILLGDMDEYARLIRGGGTLLVSGFHPEDIPDIAEGAASCGFAQQGAAEKDGWACVKFVASGS